MDHLVTAVAATLLIGILGLLILVYAGAYNVSAAVGHTAFGRWALETMMRNSVKARADADPPDRFTPAMIRAGAGEYKAMCQHCPGGPGERHAEWAKGMVPRPPDLTHAANRPASPAAARTPGPPPTPKYLPLFALA